MARFEEKHRFDINQDIIWIGYKWSPRSLSDLDKSDEYRIPQILKNGSSYMPRSLMSALRQAFKEDQYEDLERIIRDYYSSD